jgi:(E)-4-hydroxy-3-methylbut-2-enyl-diphosphate synthase
MRPPTHRIHIGRVPVGGGAPVTVQSMTKTDTRDAEATLGQIRALATAGCEIIRAAIPDAAAAEALKTIVSQSPLPVVADIHFDHRLALEALKAGVHALRINPGNIGARWKVEELVRAARDRGVPIRIGVNAGSLEKDLLERHGRPSPEAMVESALRHVEILESLDFRDIKISLKSSDVPATVEACRLMADQCNYPLHLGVTEAGTVFAGSIRSALGIGILLYEGIGDTLRVSLTGPPEEEVRAGLEILRSLGLRPGGPMVVSCPTCGRCRTDIIPIVQAVEAEIRRRGWDVHAAVMGCEVNGPGEARLAEIGIAFGEGQALLFIGGKPHRKIGLDDPVGEFIRELETYVTEKNKTDKDK